MESILQSSKDKMNKVIDHLKEELAGIRTGRANPIVLEGIKVDAYGSKMDLRDLASINAPEPRLLVVQVWDQSNSPAVEKAIRDAGQGWNPATEGNVIRVPIPPLTEERRREMTKLVSEKAESARISIRQIRRDVVEEIEKAEKTKQISEDEKFRFTEQLQKLVETSTASIDSLAKTKEGEILQI